MSVNIVTRYTKDGTPRYNVRWSRGRYDPAVHLGSWEDRAIAEVRRQKALRMLADGRVPSRAELDFVGDRNIASYAHDWLTAREGSVSAGTRQGDVTHIGYVTRKFGRLAPRMVTWESVQSWVREMNAGGLGDAQVKYRVAKLRAVLTLAGAVPNPCDDPRVILPARTSRRFIVPDNGQADIDAMRALMPEKFLGMWDGIEHGGMRMNEIEHLECATCKPDGVEIAKTDDFTPKSKLSYRTIRRLPHQPDWLPERPAKFERGQHVYGFTAEQFRAGFTAARDAVMYPGVSYDDLPASKRFRPHDLRHWHASMLIHLRAEGVHTLSDPAIAKRMGHTLAELHKTYAHDLTAD